MEQIASAEDQEPLLAEGTCEDAELVQIDVEDESASNKDFVKISRLLYTSHFLSTWNNRVFEFGAFLFLAGAVPNTLLPASIYALSASAAAVIFSQWIGQRIDSVNRLNLIRQSIFGQRLAVAISCAVLSLLAWVPSLTNSIVALAAALTVLVAMGVVEKVCAVTTLISVERDWVVIIAGGDEDRLRRLNSLMRRIDLFCKLMGPLAISLVDGISPKIAILVTAGMTVVFLPVEYFAIARVYKAIPALRIPKDAPSRDDTVLGLTAHMSRWTRTTTTTLKWYTSHHVFLASLPLALLYITVLSFSGPMTVFLLALGVPSGALGGIRGVSALFELSATWIAPRIMKRIGPVRSGIWFLNWQAFCVTAACLCLWLDVPRIWAATGLVCTVALSRVGLWGFDMSAQFLIQDEVAEPDRGRFSSQESALQNLGEMVAFGSTIIFSRPEQFRYPAVMSAGAVGLAAVLYAIFVGLYKPTKHPPIFEILVLPTSRFVPAQDTNNTASPLNIDIKTKTMVTHVVLPTAAHTHTVIFLHGRDSTAAEFAPEFFESQASDGRTLQEIFPGIKWVFPSAPTIQSARFRTDMSQWFDMYRTETPHEQYPNSTNSIAVDRQLTEASAAITTIVDEEARFIGRDHFFLGGISQGCATAVDALLRMDQRLAGFIGMCSWLPGQSAYECTLGAKQTPVLLAHCENDETIDIRYGKELRDKLVKMGCNVEWHDYKEGGHWVNEPEGVDDMVAFIQQRLPG
ncbi:hypothetical protein LTR56_025704 [Elasticomyces elasticus]|nr:hypothetical protein LTR56_025704 [Elasticomyces elasticus]KAK5760413.1 hypothetical protein LTS12_009457 [Elasticomyces elasticus]